MQYNVNTPTEYLEALEDDWRKEKLGQIRKLLKEKAPDLNEGIKFKMLNYSDEKGDLFFLNAQKNYVSLYVGDTKKVDPEGILLKGINLGKGCIRFKKTLAIKDTRIDEFIEKSVALWNKGVDLGC